MYYYGVQVANFILMMNGFSFLQKVRYKTLNIFFYIATVFTVACFIKIVVILAYNWYQQPTPFDVDINLL